MSTTTTDPIADMLSRIRNAVLVHKNEVFIPHSNVKEAVAKILKENNFIDDVKIEGKLTDKTIQVTINNPDQNARITEIVRLSSPGRRQYAKAAKIPKVKQGRGIVIVSTSNGLMTGDQAITKKIGGELICKVY